MQGANAHVCSPKMLIEFSPHGSDRHRASEIKKCQEDFQPNRGGGVTNRRHSLDTLFTPLETALGWRREWRVANAPDRSNRAGSAVNLTLRRIK